ncbi:MAG: hypothetical protein KBT03_04675 [Bacteroidales bacterium]|nr:hypothetical protein [Candidatus Scybalousia scybalohippi]
MAHKAKDLLERIKYLEKSIANKKLKVELLTAKAEGGAIRYDKENVQTSCSNFTEQILVDIADLSVEIKEDEEMLDRCISKAYKLIKLLDNIEEQNVLYGYYLDGYTYEMIADKMNYSRREVCRIEDEAIGHLEWLIEK